MGVVKLLEIMNIFRNSCEVGNRGPRLFSLHCPAGPGCSASLRRATLARASDDSSPAPPGRRGDGGRRIASFSCIPMNDELSHDWEVIDKRADGHGGRVVARSIGERGRWGCGSFTTKTGTATGSRWNPSRKSAPPRPLPRRISGSRRRT